MKPNVFGMLLLGLALLAAADPAPQFVDLFKAATAAHEAKDYPAMELRLREALKVRPGHPAALYNLAAALALRGERKDAMATLEKLVAMGLSYDPAGDADFAGLKGSERFTDIGKDFARNAKPAGRVRTVLQISDRPTYIPEGLAFDEDTDTYYLGSARQRRIQKIKRAGRDENFVLPGEGSLWAALGMVTDPDRHLLWVASAAIPEMEVGDPKDLGRSAVLAYDLRSGDRRRRYVLEDGAAAHQLGDLALARNGTIYATDNKAGILYSLDTSSGKFEALTQPGELVSPQGVVQGRNRNFLFIADYVQGLFRYDINSRTLRKLDVGSDICVYGIDGLYRYHDDLVAVQNGVRPHRVVQLEIDDGGRRVRHARVLASGATYFDEPTLGVVIGDHFDFVANSHWSRFNDKHELPGNLSGPLVLRVELEDLRRNGNDRDPLNENPSQPGGALPSLPCIGPLCR